jgi:N-acyl-D-aspartate/D-glutamate deacylase
LVVDFDLHIKGGIIIDGTRVPRFRGDLWIKDGRIAQVGGRPRGSADRVIDAEGLIVAPGFIDLHTHYDAQIRWDPYCTVSGWHGVTSVTLGNCGFGFAPCKPEFRERSMLTMTRVEAIPFASMKEGMVWDWETIPEYLDSLEVAPKGVNCLQYMPTASLMTYVMGLEAAKSRPATDIERKEMQRLLHEGMDAGLCGFSIQRMGPNSVQADFDGTPMVTDTMADEDLFALCEVLGERDEGFIEVTNDTGDLEADRRFVERMAAIAKRPIIWNPVFASPVDPGAHESSIAWLDSANEQGLRIFGQAVTSRTGFAFTLGEWNLYDSNPAWNHATTGTKEERARKLADPALRQGLRDAFDEIGMLKDVGFTTGGPVTELVVQGLNRQPELQPYLGKSVGQIAAEEGRHFVDSFIELSLAGDLNIEFQAPEMLMNPAYVADLMTRSRYTFPGVSDGGAHMKFFNGASFTTDFLLWLARDEKQITLEEAHFRLSALVAHAAGFRDRGVLREGAPADILVYDIESLAVEPHWIGEIAYDLPGGEWRRIQTAKGYRAIIVNGEVTFEDGVCTGATPGRLLRYGRG